MLRAIDMLNVTIINKRFLLLLKPTLVVLHIVPGLSGGRGVLLHYVVVHQSGASEQTETSGAAEYATNHMLRCFLQPMADGVLKFLIPYHLSLIHI